MVIGTDSRQANSYALPIVSENSQASTPLNAVVHCQQRYDQNKRKPVVRQPLHRRPSPNGLWHPNPKAPSKRKSAYEVQEEQSQAQPV